MGAHQAIAQTSIFSGRLEEGLEHAEQGMALFDPAAPLIGSWPGAQPDQQCYVYGGLARWLTGYPDSALQLVDTALDMIRASRDESELPLHVGLGALIPLWRGDYATVRHWTEESIALCNKRSMDFFRRLSECLLASALLQETPTSANLDELERAIAAYEALGQRLLVPVFLGILAGHCLDLVHVERGLAATERGLSLIRQTNEAWMEAELHRLCGELLLATTPQRPQAADESIRRAIELARGQGARSLELRALGSLVRTQADRVGEGEAQTQLAACYSQFTEGLKTADLREAKAVLGGDRAAAT